MFQPRFERAGISAGLERLQRAFQHGRHIRLAQYSEGGHPGYHASKGAVRIYSKAAAVRYGPHGVRVNTVHPGYLPPMLNGTNANARALAVEQTPLRRIGVAMDVAYGVLYLASDEASFVTGSELVIDGGWLAQ